MPSDYHFDNTRYQTHEHLKTPCGRPVLRPDHNYIVVWGYWNGLDEVLATKDQAYCRGINLVQALHESYILGGEYDMLMENAAGVLTEHGFEDLNPKGTHLMLSVDLEGKLIRNDDGSLSVRFCNFSLMRRT